MKGSIAKAVLMMATTARASFIGGRAPDLEFLKRPLASEAIESEHHRTGRLRQVWLGVLICLLTLLGIKNAFIQDDAFISFRYADNLVQHDNFSWNADDSVKLEGYTNFLWTIMMAGCIKLGLSPELWSIVLGIFLGAGTLIVTYRIGLLVFDDFRYAMLAVFILGTNYSFSSYMTGGLETQLQTLLITIVAFFAFSAMQKNESATVDFLSIGFFSALAILTRLDTPLIIGMLILPMLYFRFGALHGDKIKKTVLGLVWMALPVVLITVPWLYWKYRYYGDILPNSYYLKGNFFSPEVFKNGLYYLFTFFSSYYIILFIPLLAFQLRRAVRNKFILTIGIVLAAWLVYILKVGGDFMEFRFFVPVLPMMMIVIAWSIKELNNTILKYACVLVLFFGSINHEVLFFDYHGTDSVSKLHGLIYDKKTNWRGIGVRLNELFGNERDRVVIATTAAGAIPYYSKLKTIDMFGVNDKWIAINGDVTKDFKPGHYRNAKLDYYTRANVNLIIGHPEVRRAKWSRGRERIALVDFDNFRISSLDKGQLPSNAKIVEIPIDEEFSIFALYLRPLPEIDAILRKNNIKTFGID